MARRIIESPASSQDAAENTDSEDLPDEIFGWRISLRQLCLAALAYQTTRTLQLVKLRQAKTLELENKPAFNFAKLPLELFDMIVQECRLAAINHAEETHPCMLLNQWTCACMQLGSARTQAIVDGAIEKHYKEEEFDDGRGEVPNLGIIHEWLAHYLYLSGQARLIPCRAIAKRGAAKVICASSLQYDLECLAKGRNVGANSRLSAVSI